MSRQKLGQHFLVNQSVALSIVKEFLPATGPIVEIGPGKGILTRLLAASRPGQPIFAIEMDEKLALDLQSENMESVTVLRENILHIRLEELAPGGTINLLGNLPYGISHKIIDWVLKQPEKINQGVFMVQKEFLDKIQAARRNQSAGPQSILFSLLFEIQKLFFVRPGSFSPPPRVLSSVFRFKPALRRDCQDTDWSDFYSFLQAAFSQRRKSLLNNLRSPFTSGALRNIFFRLKLAENSRAESVPPEQLLKLYQLCQEK